MKKVLKSLGCFFERLGRARAAGEYARLGRHDLARAVLEEKCQHC